MTGCSVLSRLKAASFSVAVCSITAWPAIICLILMQRCLEVEEACKRGMLEDSKVENERSKCKETGELDRKVGETFWDRISINVCRGMCYTVLAEVCDNEE